RMLAPYTALAYDWLHDQLAPELRARARQRWSSWLTWYREKGYRSRAPGNNYQAGYLISATMIAIAEAGEGDPALWSWVADELWGKDMAAALASGGILEGGDWAEGWQYGPLSVAEYALAARVASRAGVLRSLQRHGDHRERGAQPRAGPAHAGRGRAGRRAGQRAPVGAQRDRP